MICCSLINGLPTKCLCTHDLENQSLRLLLYNTKLYPNFRNQSIQCNLEVFFPLVILRLSLTSVTLPGGCPKIANCFRPSSKCGRCAQCEGSFDQASAFTGDDCAGNIIFFNSSFFSGIFRHRDS